MTWYKDVIDGSLSVKVNRPRLNANSTYIDTTMKKDHQWDAGGTLDGRHIQAMMPKLESGGTPTDPVIAATGCDLAYYAKQKTSTESPSNQDVQPFGINAWGAMQLLGIRACGLFTYSPISVQYSHNLALQSDPTPGIVRENIGLFNVTFATALPSANYLVFVGAQRSTTGLMICSVRSAATENSKTTTGMKLVFDNSSFNVEDPAVAWFVCFGG